MKLAALALGLLLLSACGGGGGSTSPAVSATACPLPGNYTLALAYPDPGSMSVSTGSAGAIWLAESPATIGGTLDVELVESAIGTVIPLVLVSATTPPPTPFTTGPYYVEYQVQSGNGGATAITWSPGTAYTVDYLYVAQSSCTEYSEVPGAAFTTN